MQYFEAVQAGKKRASESQMRLFKLAGFAMLTLTTKKVDGRFAPVGEEDYAAAIKSPDGHIVILVDGDGYTKAQTKPMEPGEADTILAKVLGSGVPEFAGDSVMIWNDTYPVVRPSEEGNGGKSEESRD